jgi:IS30 family transposase
LSATDQVTLRQYLPRGTDLSLHSQAKLSAIARQLNEMKAATSPEEFWRCSVLFTKIVDGRFDRRQSKLFGREGGLHWKRLLIARAKKSATVVRKHFVNTMTLNNSILMHLLRMRRRLAEAKNRRQGGAWQFGVLKALAERGLTFDAVSGTPLRHAEGL